MHIQQEQVQAEEVRQVWHVGFGQCLSSIRDALRGRAVRLVVSHRRFAIPDKAAFMQLPDRHERANSHTQPQREAIAVIKGYRAFANGDWTDRLLAHRTLFIDHE